MESLRYSLADPNVSALAGGYQDSEIYEIDLRINKFIDLQGERMRSVR